jgi:hypothetical protein
MKKWNPDHTMDKTIRAYWVRNPNPEGVRGRQTTMSSKTRECANGGHSWWRHDMDAQGVANMRDVGYEVEAVAEVREYRVVDTRVSGRRETVRVLDEWSAKLLDARYGFRVEVV